MVAPQVPNPLSENMNKIFFRGLVTLLPIALTIYIVYSAVLILENLLGSVLRWVLPDHFYIPGFGFVLTILLIFMFGLLLNNFLAARLLLNLELQLLRVPFINTVYGPLKDLMNLFSKKNDAGLQSVVLVHFGSARMMGIVTRENFSDVKLNFPAGENVAVYIPFSYALGGLTVVVPRSDVTPVNLPIEKAMSLAITAWVKTEKTSGGPNP